MEPVNKKVNTPLPKREGVRRIVIDVDQELFDEADKLRKKRKISKKAMVQYGLKVFIEQNKK